MLISPTKNRGQSPISHSGSEDTGNRGQSPIFHHQPSLPGDALPHGVDITRLCPATVQEPAKGQNLARQGSMILRAEIYVVTSENSKKLYRACEKQVNPNSVVSSICAFTKQCERFVGAVNVAALVNLLEGREK